MKVKFILNGDNTSYFKCNAEGKELLAAVNLFASEIAAAMQEPADKILYKAWMAEMSLKLNNGKGYKKNEQNSN